MYVRRLATISSKKGSQARSREEIIARLRQYNDSKNELDVLIIGTWLPFPLLTETLTRHSFSLLLTKTGGGATGSGAALDAAMRGLKVLCIEKEDFASGTSSRSTKLIWGGSRYLVQAFASLLNHDLRYYLSLSLKLIRHDRSTTLS